MREVEGACMWTRRLVEILLRLDMQHTDERE